MDTPFSAIGRVAALPGGRNPRRLALYWQDRLLLAEAGPGTCDGLAEGDLVEFTLASPDRFSAVARLGGAKAAGESSAAGAGGDAQGIKKTAKKFHVNIVGGDTVSSNKLIINVALTGEAKRNEVVYRSGARKGDQIFRKNSCVFGPGDIYCSMWSLLGLAGLSEAEWTPQYNYWQRPAKLDDGGENLIE